MNQMNHRLGQIASNNWFVIIGGVSSIASGLVLVYQWTAGGLLLWPAVLVGATSTLVLLFTVYSFRVRAENKSLRDLSLIFCDINRMYRDSLRALMASEGADFSKRLAVECDVLKNVAQRIENIYSKATNSQCLCTIKLVAEDEDGEYAKTYVRSQGNHVRDDKAQRFSVGEGKNTAFDEARRKQPAQPHFFSADLKRETDYYNERQDYLRHYQSALVVPIYGGSLVNGQSRSDWDMIGYLCVDTLSTNRLNNTFHLHMASALAAQMYAFMKTIRGREWHPLKEAQS